jgi:hypothetical protein
MLLSWVGRLAQPTTIELVDPVSLGRPSTEAEEQSDETREPSFGVLPVRIPRAWSDFNSQKVLGQEDGSWKVGGDARDTA